MYDHLLSYIGQRDIRQTFMNLREASLTSHLPAFRRCSRQPIHFSYDSPVTSPPTPLTWLLLLGAGIIIGRASRKGI